MSSLVPILFGSKSTAADDYSNTVTVDTAGDGGDDDDVPFWRLDHTWDPFCSLLLVSSMAGGGGTSRLHDVQIEWKETPTSHVFKADLPGLKRDEVKVEVEEQRFLKIQGERAEEEDHKHCWRRRAGRSSPTKFLTGVPLPADAAAGDAEAVLENGVLTVTVPRNKDKKAQSRVIRIQG